MRSPLLPILTALTVCASIAQASPATDARRAIQSAYTSMDAAIRHRDAAAAAAYYAPGYVSIDPKGHRATAQQEQQSAAGIFAGTRGPIAAKTAIQAFTLSGPNAATVTAREHMAATLVNPQTKQTAKVVFDATSRDLWIKTGRGWRQKQTQALATAMTVNGRPVPQN